MATPHLRVRTVHGTVQRVRYPAVSLPLALSREGLPIGVQLVAATGREDLLLQVAAQLEQAAPWKDRQPSIFVD
ncbi:hypothetical protein ACVH9Z_13435 [Rhodococcus opacus]